MPALHPSAVTGANSLQEAFAITCRLHFDPAEVVQVAFGAGPMLTQSDGVLKRTWAFVRTLCFSRHQYVEFVWDQTVASGLGCHRRAFEWFAAVPARVIHFAHCDQLAGGLAPPSVRPC